MSRTLRTTGYVVLEGKRSQYGSPSDETGLRELSSIRMAELRINRPRTLKRDQISVKVTIEVPAEAFDPIAPAALIVVPGDLIQRGPITTEATDANDS